MLYLPFSVLHDPIPLLSSRVFWRLYALFAISVLHDPIPLLLSRVFWRLYALFAIFSTS